MANECVGDCNMVKCSCGASISKPDGMSLATDHYVRFIREHALGHGGELDAHLFDEDCVWRWGNEPVVHYILGWLDTEIGSREARGERVIELKLERDQFAAALEAMT